MESKSYSPYIRSLIASSMNDLKLASSTKLFAHICKNHKLEPTNALRVRMIRACKSMIAELEMTPGITENKTPIYTIKLIQK